MSLTAGLLQALEEVERLKRDKAILEYAYGAAMAHLDPSGRRAVVAQLKKKAEEVRTNGSV